MATARLSVRRWEPGETRATRSFVRVEVSERSDGQTIVRIEHVGGPAPHPGSVVPVLAACHYRGEPLVTVQHWEENGEGRIAIRWPDPLRTPYPPVGVWGRTGRTGAYWGHAWAAAKDEESGLWYRAGGRPLVYWHVSMRGVLNEPVWGVPFMLASWALQHYAADLRAGVRYEVLAELPLLDLPGADDVYPVPAGSYEPPHRIDIIEPAPPSIEMEPVPPPPPEPGI